MQPQSSVFELIWALVFGAHAGFDKRKKSTGKYACFSGASSALLMPLEASGGSHPHRGCACGPLVIRSESMPLPAELLRSELVGVPGRARRQLPGIQSALGRRAQTDLGQSRPQRDRVFSGYRRASSPCATHLRGRCQSRRLGRTQAEPRLPHESVELFKEWYLNITRRSAQDYSLGTGWYPDALIPATRWSGKLFPKSYILPFDIPDLLNNIGPEQQNQAVWVDVYVPKDRRQAPPGTLRIHDHGVPPMRAIGRVFR